ncbi:MAG: exodeoxyribonuclease VII large subunit [Chlamydiales bacterium]|jgi:exodeoxyribonuclease VII large subunit
MASTPSEKPQRGLFDDLKPEPAPGSSARAAKPAARPKAAAVPKPAVPAKPVAPVAPGASGASGPRVFSVTEVTEHILRAMRGMGRLAVEGEITSLRTPASGHAYFDLKDDGALIHCAIWRSRLARAANFRLEEGMRVVCHGDLDVYKPRGNYNLIVQRVEQRGIGALLAQLEALKVELKGRGWFERARPLPRLPQRIGVVTSRDGAAFQDFLRTRSVRWPMYPVRLAHCLVQGRDCARGIAQAIRSLDASGVDVIVIARGGGSIEDLWGFNELAVAEAIWAASVPVISGVGHETDLTLADLVADHRAHTPTDAAQMVIPDETSMLDVLERLQGYLVGAVGRQIETREEALDRLARARTLRRPEQLLQDRAQRASDLGKRLESAGMRRGESGLRALGALEVRIARQSPALRLERLSARLDALGKTLTRSLVEPLGKREARLDLAARALEATSPLAVLGRGYSIMRRADGSAVRRSDELKPGESVETLLAHGRVFSEVQRVTDDAERDEDS